MNQLAIPYENCQKDTKFCLVYNIIYFIYVITWITQCVITSMKLNLVVSLLGQTKFEFHNWAVCLKHKLQFNKAVKELKDLLHKEL